MRTLFLAILLAIQVGVLVLPAGLSAQDVELWGRIHGTRPPESYYELKRQDPGAFRFQRALFRRGLGLPEPPPVRARGVAAAQALQVALAGARSPEPVTGSFTFPLILGLYFDSETPDAAFGPEAVQAEFFDGPQAKPGAVGTIPEFYAEISGGRVSLAGETFDWVRTDLTRNEVTGGVSGLGGTARIGAFIDDILSTLDDGSIDWGRYDNDGPDGVPNSGDDDGYVDILTIMHPTPGGECSGSSEQPYRIWSHRWNLLSLASYERSGGWATSVMENEGWVTSTPATPSLYNDFPFIRLYDYTMQPVKDCDDTNINAIGVFAHELGHGFGLPDLYNTGDEYGHSGIGNWGLMGSGSWGCNGVSPEVPCHMNAWSKERLGWANVEVLPPGTDLGSLTLPPVETSGTIYRMDAGDGSGEYILLENRQRLGFDANLYGPGLLVWHVDPDWVVTHRYSVNADPNHMGVWLREADGRGDLTRSGGGRGGPDDPFPGSRGTTVFHAGSEPGSWSHAGQAMGITLTDIQLAGQDLTFSALTRYQTLLLRTLGSPSGSGLISLDGVQGPGLEWEAPSAPYQVRLLEAAPGEELMGEGVRVGFQGWEDGGPRVREYVTPLHDTTFAATYGGREVHVAVELVSPVEGISPGYVDFTPGDEEGWVPEGETVAVTAVPQTGFGFREWTGDLAGRPNPSTLTVDEPLEIGALFDVTFSTASNPAVREVEAATVYVLELAVEHANAPVIWTLSSGDLPDGMGLDQDGFIRGAALEAGSFPLAFSVVDGIGLEGALALDLVVVDPELPVTTLASPFFLNGASLNLNQKTYLDQEGNRNGAYDLGDFRAYVLRNPLLSASGPTAQPVEMRVLLGETRNGTGGAGNDDAGEEGER